jgi:hypothetical protein
MRTANVVAHYNVRQISTAFHIPAAIARAAHILQARPRINLFTGQCGALPARIVFRNAALQILCYLSALLN